MTNNKFSADSLCPCCSGANYQDCCQPLHQQKQIAQTPEQLMRSRFCAFFLKEYRYLIETHHSDHLDGLNEQALAQDPLPQWLSLDIISSEQDGDTGQVCFQAWYKLENELDAIHETSDFIKQDGRWFYTQGEQKTPILPKRNDKCVCHSGKKFKQCCAK
ncbi:YchJ family protein [Shewanella schlegeliana]|uniref:YchJ family protein n=1 Tax=Shewanella schlegeliana TaxID=190308 RepID=A0ABS1SU24_9GAMM|nr:YchJ family protein [Shewanella schlegeliana]MBL4912041.1 YchJ family protein [Shewanella schlegeliana]MCL1111362.1 YchJ family protein [Shewanella schlegeliana]